MEKDLLDYIRNNLKLSETAYIKVAKNFIVCYNIDTTICSYHKDDIIRLMLDELNKGE